MEVIFKELNIHRIGGGCVSQALIEGSIPVIKDRTAASVIDASAAVRLQNTEISAGKVNIDGTVQVHIIALDTDDSVFSFSSSAPFKHSIAIDSARPGMEASVIAELQSVELSAEGDSLKLTAVSELSLRLKDNTPLRVVKGMNGVSELEIKTMKLDYRENKCILKEKVRILEEIGVSSITSVLAVDGEAVVRSIRTRGDAVTVEGTLSVSAMCADGKERLSQFVQHVEFSEELDFDGRAEAVFGRVAVEEIELRPMDAELGIAVVEAVMRIELFSESVAAEELPLDAFSPSAALMPKITAVPLLLPKGMLSVKSSLRETIDVPEGMPDIYRPVYASARPMVTSSVCGEGRLNIDGMLFTRLVYASENGSLFSFTEDIPFMLSQPLSGDMGSGGAADAEVRLRVLTTVGGGGGRAADVGYLMFIDAELFEPCMVEAVTGIAECEPVESPKGIVICFASEGEELYDIAKRLNVSRAALTELNPELENGIRGGERIVVMV